MVMSRNKREGKYVGCSQGMHVRAIPQLLKNDEFWAKVLKEDYSWDNVSWPCNGHTWCKLHKRGITVTYKRYTSKDKR